MIDYDEEEEEGGGGGGGGGLACARPPWADTEHTYYLSKLQDLSCRISLLSWLKCKIYRTRLLFLLFLD